MPLVGNKKQSEKGRMMSMGKDASTPSTPDYAGAAQAQGAANVETARAQGRMNNPNVYTPYGSQTVTWGQGTPQFNQAGYDQANQQYNTALQSYNSGQGGSTQIGTDEWGAPLYSGSGGGGSAPIAPTREQFTTSGNNDQPTVTQTLSAPQQQLLDSQNRISQNLAGVAESGINRVSQGFNQPFNTSGLPSMQTSVNGGNFTNSVAYAPLQSNYDQGGAVRYETGYNQPIQGSLDYSGAPKLPGTDDFSADRKRVEDALYARLNPQFQLDEDALRTRLSNQGLTQGTDAWNREMDVLNRSRNDARNQVLLSGGNEQSRLFGLASNARGQYTGEQNTMGNFANAAQAQGYGQAQGNLAAYNTAQAQENQQGLQAGNFANAAASGNFGMGQQNAALNNQVGQQEFQQALANVNLNNQGRATGIQEQAYLRSLPLNELNSLRTGAQVTNPQFQPYQGATIGQTPVFGAAQAQGAYDQNLYNQQVGQQNAATSGLFGIGAAAAGAAGMPWWASAAMGAR